MMDGDGGNGAQEQPHLGVSYDGFAPVLIEAVKELRAEKDAEIESLRDENKALKTAMDNLISRLELIEARTD
jgi:hypothetical protein